MMWNVNLFYIFLKKILLYMKVIVRKNLIFGIKELYLVYIHLYQQILKTFVLII